MKSTISSILFQNIQEFQFNSMEKVRSGRFKRSIRPQGLEPFIPFDVPKELIQYSLRIRQIINRAIKGSHPSSSLDHNLLALNSVAIIPVRVDLRLRSYFPVNLQAFFSSKVPFCITNLYCRTLFPSGLVFGWRTCFVCQKSRLRPDDVRFQFCDFILWVLSYYYCKIARLLFWYLTFSLMRFLEIRESFLQSFFYRFYVVAWRLFVSTLA